MKNIFRRTLVIGIGCLVICTPTFAQTVPPEEITPHPYISDSRAVLEEEAKVSAKLHGVSLDQARSELVSQELIGKINGDLITNSSFFGGLWIDHTAKLLNIGVVKAETNSEFDSRVKSIQGTISQYGSLYYAVAFIPVDFSFQELTDYQKRISEHIMSLGLRQTSVNLDTPKNRIVLETADTLDAQKLATEIGYTLPGELPIVIVPTSPDKKPMPMTQVYGGLQMSTTGTSDHQCSSSFAAYWGDGALDKRRLLTAAHCANALTVNGHALTFKAEYYGGQYDVQWHSVTGSVVPGSHYVRNLVWNGAYDRSIYSGAVAGDHYAGRYVYVWLHKSNQYVETQISIPSASNMVGPVYMTDYVITTTGNAIGGDSGGPVMWSTTAIGVFFGTYSSPYQGLLYMKIHKINDLGIILLTTAP